MSRGWDSSVPRAGTLGSHKNPYRESLHSNPLPLCPRRESFRYATVGLEFGGSEGGHSKGARGKAEPPNEIIASGYVRLCPYISTYVKLSKLLGE
jgi:hypothetical protein